MTNDLQDLRATLRARAEADADAEAMLAAVGPAYRRRRSRRIAATTAVVAAVAVLATMTAPRLLAGGAPIPGPAGSAGPSAPASAGSVVPGGIGSEPERFHFAVGDFPFKVIDDRWTTGTNLETLWLQGFADNPGNEHDVVLSAQLTLWPAAVSPPPPPDPTSGAEPALEDPQSGTATIGGQPATVETWKSTGQAIARITWQPGAGVRAELKVGGPLALDKVLAFAGTVRLDHGRPCTLRLKPTTLPAGAKVVSCTIQPTFGMGSLAIRGPGGDISVVVPREPAFAAGVSPGATAKTLPNGGVYEQFGPHDYYSARIRVIDPYAEVAAHGTYGIDDVILVANGLQPS